MCLGGVQWVGCSPPRLLLWTLGHTVCLPSKPSDELFIFLLIAICLAVSCIIALHWKYLSHYFGLLGTVILCRLCLKTIKLQTKCWIQWTLCRIFNWFIHTCCSYSCVFLSSLNNNVLINQAGSYYILYVITNFMEWHPVISHYLNDIIVITLDLGLYQSCVNNDIIPVMR